MMVLALALQHETLPVDARNGFAALVPGEASGGHTLLLVE